MGQKISTLCSCLHKRCCSKRSTEISSQLYEAVTESDTLLQPLRRHINVFDIETLWNPNEDLNLIWLDEHIDTDMENTIRMKDLFEQITGHVLLCSSKETFFECYEKMTNQTLFVIISGQLAVDVLPLINETQKIHAIYIFCMIEDCYQYMIGLYSNLSGIFNDPKDLILKIQKDIDRYLKQLIKFNTFNQEESKSIIDLSIESAEFVWCYILRDVLINIETSEVSKQLMIDYCRSEYQTNNPMLQQIVEFEKNYQSENAIEWYTKDSFVHRLVNKSLRNENINALSILAFFIRDLSTSLKLKWENDFGHRDSKTVRVFRGTQLTNDDIRKLKAGSLISTNGYLSTSRSYETAGVYASNAVFEIEIDPLAENLIFADISEYSYFPEEEEILFDLGSTFQIISIDYDENNQRTIFKMIGTNQGEKIANEYIRTIKDKKKTKGYFDGLLSDFVQQVGFKKFLQMYEHSLTVSANDGTKIIKNLSKFIKLYEQCCDTSNVTILFGSIGWFFLQRAEYDLAIEYCTQALLLVEKISPNDNIDIEIAVIHNTIGWSYNEKGEYDLALSWCCKAKKILERCSYVEYSKYAKVLQSEGKTEKCSSRNDVDYAEILTSIGCIYYNKHDFDRAKLYCTKSLDVLASYDCDEIVSENHHATTTSNYAFDNHHEIIATNYEVFADIHYQNGNYNLALEYYRKALDLYEKIIPNIPICLQRSPHIFGRNKQRLQNSICMTEKKYT